jgi:O-antigen/teichoic acid export membrane protein
MGKSNITLSLKSILVNFSHLAFGEFASKAFGFLTTVYLARTLGVEQFGEYAWVLSVFAFALMVSNFGFETYGIRAISQNTSHTLISGIIFLRIVYSTIVFSLLSLLNMICFDQFNVLLLFQSFSLLLLPLNTQYVFKGLNKAKYDGIYKIAHAILFLSVIALIVKNDSLLFIPVIWFFITFGMNYVWYRGLKNMLHFSYSFPTAADMISIVRGSVPVGIASALILLYLTADTVLLGLYHNDESVGIYSAANRIYSFGFGLLSLFYIAFLPSLSSVRSDRFFLIVKKFVTILLLFSVIIMLMSLLFSESIISLLYGSMYNASKDILTLLLVSLSVSCISFAMINPFQAISDDKTFIILLGIRTVVFIILCLILIPAYGAFGAAGATLIAEIFCVIYSIPVFVNRMKSFPIP